MTISVFIAVLFAALLHASWNVLVKGCADRFVSVALVALFAGLTALPLLPLCAALPAAAWYWLGLSVLFHTVYGLFLSRAYSHGDLGTDVSAGQGLRPPVGDAAQPAAATGETPAFGERRRADPDWRGVADGPARRGAA
ncbi:Integral membrane protein [Edwardsiella anguillarum ET080813]|uniref:Integral membrane protein n=1 Tax=Edwardsiella anguillarum ET080813 TaxID=667120 RepID=A0A076LW76_9GAMM|nr:Integral membrane protein [Edwardsiella anguillarum ET080813]